MTKYIGVMSGTSLDGIDLVLCAIDEHSCTLLHAQEYPYHPGLKNEVLGMIQNPTTLKSVGELNVKLGLMFADAINAFMSQYEIDKTEIEAIGLHGQTLWHAPDAKYPFSMQLGSASVVAAKTAIDVVSDFRSADIANGGQGAPFAPAFHKFLFGGLGKNIAVVNIGGMANVTLLGERYLGWDCGCGNVLLDTLIQKAHNKSYDKDGALARSGEVNNELLHAMLGDPYFAKQPPKSTGREYFNFAWLENYLKDFIGLSDEDMLCTLTELTAQVIANDTKNTEEIILCGGGAKNGYLRERIQILSKTKVSTSDDHSISGDFVEAMIFAWLAHKRLHRQSVDLKAITGATKNSILGTITCS